MKYKLAGQRECTPRVTSAAPSTRPVLSNGDMNNTCMSWLDMDDLNVSVSEVAMRSMNVSLSCHDSLKFSRKIQKEQCKSTFVNLLLQVY